MTVELGPVPTGVRRRILTTYGPAAEGWLQTVPETLAVAAERWGLRLRGYHDAGHASVIALADHADGTQLLVKTWFDDRYQHEVTALRLWRSGPVPQIAASADDLKTALIVMVGGRVGGRPRPRDDASAVARAIVEVHAAMGGETDHEFPTLAEYWENEVLPRTRRRAATLAASIPEDCVDAGLAACDVLPGIDGLSTLLHADLYRENVLWDEHANPVLIDPLPMVGDAAFDWAFWAVYYDLAQGQVERLQLARRFGDVPAEGILAWALALSFDGLLYYLETRDGRVRRMLDVLRTLASLRLAMAPP